MVVSPSNPAGLFQPCSHIAADAVSWPD